MGLDMFLYCIDKSDKEKKKIEIGYWRKANAIHRWFVKNIQNNNDDCKCYNLSKENIINLKELCIKVKNDKQLACKLLPTQSGFFFGSTEYNEDYFDDLEETIKICNKVLNELDFEKYECVYSSWW